MTSNNTKITIQICHIDIDFSDTLTCIHEKFYFNVSRLIDFFDLCTDCFHWLNGARFIVGLVWFQSILTTYANAHVKI